MKISVPLEVEISELYSQEELEKLKNAIKEEIKNEIMDEMISITLNVYNTPLISNEPTRQLAYFYLTKIEEDLRKEK